MALDTSSKALALALARLLSHLDDQEYSANKDCTEAARRHNWLAGYDAERWGKAMRHVQRELAGLLTGEDQAQNPKRVQDLIYDLREAAGLDGNEEDWPE